MPPQPITTARRARRARARVLKTRAEPGRDAAADQRHAVERHVAADAHERVLVHEHALGEGAQVHELRDRLAVLREARRLVGTAHRRLALAEVRAAGDAVLARAAEGREAADHVVAGRDVAHLARRRPRRRPPARGRGRSAAGSGAIPRGRGGRCGRRPVATVRTSTSRGPGASISISSIASGSPIARITAAFMRRPPRSSGSDSSPRRKIIGFQRGSPARERQVRQAPEHGRRGRRAPRAARATRRGRSGCPSAKATWRSALAAHVERVGIGELARIAVGRRHERARPCRRGGSSGRARGRPRSRSSRSPAPGPS